ncbi:DUF5753 domain-containing protein [Actinokineospora enzanensis]|uniref:DUF5753 domain-containing protein n=1 Tax=Actinokineospora enzanensis TaxID=155975 RepID=UPI00037A9FF4|nr:DUF5753 domain-containing protein [Actinokineospora enzanensis]
MSVPDRALGWYTGKLARVEAGDRTLAKAEVDKLADLYGVTPDERATLHLLDDAARKRETPSRVADFAQTYVTLERQAMSIDYFDETLLHALVATDEYSAAVLATEGDDDLGDRLAARAARRAILSSPNPPRLRVLLGEAALHREVGGPRTLHDQLAYLLEVTRSPAVAIRILPFASGAHRALGVNFTLITLAEPSIARVYIEALTDATYLHEQAEVEIYRTAFERRWSAALDDESSATIVRRRIAQLEDTSGG